MDTSSSAASDETQKPKPLRTTKSTSSSTSPRKAGKTTRGEYETRTEWHRVYAWRNLSKFAKTLQKGQLITLEGTLKYRKVEEDVEGANFKHRIAEIHAISMKRLSKVETPDGPSDDPTTSSRRPGWMSLWAHPP